MGGGDKAPAGTADAGRPNTNCKFLTGYHSVPYNLSTDGG